VDQGSEWILQPLVCMVLCSHIVGGVVRVVRGEGYEMLLTNRGHGPMGVSPRSRLLELY